MSEENKSTALAPWEAEMAQYAEEAAAAEKSGGFKTINIRSANIMIDDAPVPGNELEIIVLAAVHENQFYVGDYDPNSPQIPTCYAFGDIGDADPEENMGPPDDVTEKQSEKCKDCPQNQWGSGKGRGKACSNVRRLAVMPADALETGVEEAEVRVLKVSVTNTKNWSNYVRNKLLEVKRAPWGVVTKIKVKPDPKKQYDLSFHLHGLVNFDEKTYTAIKAKAAEAERVLRTPYPKAEPVAAPAQKGRKKF